MTRRFASIFGASWTRRHEGQRRGGRHAVQQGDEGRHHGTDLVDEDTHEMEREAGD